MSISLFIRPQNYGKIRIPRKLQSLYFQQIHVRKFLSMFQNFKYTSSKSKMCVNGRERT
ncbi:hypothetical protein Fmac_019705 [Flemingia macrophylla]|uniref:Uncharacterized protein n=1 Tax=Flemingia macrophylla TaxID=520843 RepID=A0ABD1M8J4_9FABA